MRPRALVGTIVLLILLAAPRLESAVLLHNFDCKRCHTPDVSMTSLGHGITNICLQCHKPAGPGTDMLDGRLNVKPAGKIVVQDASDAMGVVKTTMGSDPTLQTSHNWAASKDVFSAAGALSPSTTLYRSRYGISSGKITCSRCHDPHVQDVANAKLLRISDTIPTADAMCLECHRQWRAGAGTNGYLTHPIVANYADYVTNQPDKYKPFTDNTVGKMALVSGGVSCMTCHGVHFVDSDSSTDDGPGAALSTGDGKLLRADGPKRTHADEATRAQLRSNLCQACHTYGRHGIGRTHPIGCLDCHSGHSYDKNNTAQPNYYVLRPLKNSSSVYLPKTGDLNLTSLTLNYKTLTTEWANGGGSGYCQQCHNLPFPHNGVASGNWDKATCGTCHFHNAAGGSFAANCNSCHGYPPSQNVAGGAPNSGYAYVVSPARDYSGAPNTKNESQTAHARHAATSQYKISCDRCHADVINNGQHNNGTYQNVNFDAFSGTGLTPDAYAPGGNAGNGQCGNIYCHSNGGARTGDGARSYVAATIPAWQGGDIANCTSCHGNSAGTMGNNSASHIKHLNKGYSCNVCHEGTAVNATTLVASAIGGDHVDGNRDVLFDQDYDIGEITLGDGVQISYAAGFGTCGIYCHSNGSGTYATPDWDTASTGACGTCHKLDVASGDAITSGSHTAHINDSDVEIGRNVGCAECHSNTVSNNTTISNQSNHVNGAITLGIAADANQTACNNISCHSNGNYDSAALVYKTAGVDFVWGGPALTGCDDCHGDGAGKAYPTYANGGVAHDDANSHSTHIVGAGAACGDCHSETSTAGATINGTDPTKHVNKAIDVKGTKINGGAAGSFNSTTKTCSTVSCHGGNDPVWGDTLTCGDCHLRSAGDADDFTYNNGTLAMLDTEEWLYSGHGKAAGNYDVTNRGAANFAGTDPCLYCHDDTVSHGGANYFRLRQNGKPDLNGACLGCHATDSAGVDPDGAGTDFANKNSTVKIDKYHGGAKHNGTDRDAGRWCWDCHDPHGDADTAGLRIQMIQRRLAVDPDANGKPASLTGTDIIFTNNTKGAEDNTGFARNAPPYAEGICNACHTQTAQYKTDLGANGHYTAKCTQCHNHSENGSYGATAFKATCYGCHGGGTTGTNQKNFWPDGNVNGADGSGSIDDSGEHQVHMTQLADRAYGESIAQLLTDNTAGNPALSSETKQKTLCAYCHLDPGADADHAGSTPADDAEVTQFKRIWDGTANDSTPGAPVFTRVNGTCSNIDCHKDKTTAVGTYGWYDAGTSACIMCHADVTAATTPTGITHTEHAADFASASTRGIVCTICHAAGTAWPTTKPSTGHLDGQLTVNASVNYDSGSCLNMCHNGGKYINAQSKYKDPNVPVTWGVTVIADTNCAACHNYFPFPTTEGHSAHYSAKTVFTSYDMDCMYCHVNPYAVTHFDGNVDLSTAMGYDGNRSVVSGSDSFGNCNTKVCHQNGRGDEVPTPDWNGSSAVGPCELCHANVPATGSHSKHVQSAPTAYAVAAGNDSTVATYDFNCGNCHPVAVTPANNHLNSVTWTAGNVKVDVTLNNTHGEVNSLKSKNNIANDTGGYSQTRGTSVTCSAAYCHSALNASNSRVFGTTPNWYGGSFAGDPCAGCHGNSPDGGAHKAHEVGFHYNAVYSGTTGFLPVTDSDPIPAGLTGIVADLRGHGNAKSTVISCQVCHNATVQVSYNDKNSKCDDCHGISVATKGSAVIADKQYHINGVNDVVFVDQKIRSKAQIRDSLSDVPELGNNWTRMSGYKAADGSSYDETPNTLYNSATFTSADKSCTVACHLWEADRVDKIKPKWDDGAIMCIDCHSRLPK